jgi:transcriptional regulator with GAF, ATPase, and Fis domain
MRVADSRRPSRLLRFRARSEAPAGATESLDDHNFPTDIRELKRIRNRIIILAVRGLAAFLVSWCAKA